MSTFLEIYEEAKDLCDGENPHSPHNPVVRYGHTRGWSIESDLSPADDDCIISVSLDDFESYFYEGFIDPSFTPSPELEAEYMRACLESQALQEEE